ncbi:MAG: TIM barrel protein [Planctomycetaceae bacterium]|nr:TIM barrel protein [Planctomycetaceae bacterium]
MFDPQLFAWNRRQFLAGSGACATALLASQLPMAWSAETDAFDPTICAFTESFQDMPIPEVCGLFRNMGLDGLDLTVRPGGHISPENAPRQLPDAAQAAKDHGVSIPMLTTGITEANAVNERLVATAGEHGIRRIKLGYFRYGQFGSLRQQLDDIRRQLDDISQMTHKHDVLPCMHIHSGNTIPSHGTQLYLLLKDMSPDMIGAYVDPMHMTIEGGQGGWKQGLDLLAPWIHISSIKNFQWREHEASESGQRHWRPLKVPIADGQADLRAFLAALKTFGNGEVLTLHSEYKGGNSFKDMTTQECIEQTRKDLAHLRVVLASL